MCQNKTIWFAQSARKILKLAKFVLDSVVAPLIGRVFNNTCSKITIKNNGTF
jgi:hypothetical protein